MAKGAFDSRLFIEAHVARAGWRMRFSFEICVVRSRLFAERFPRKRLVLGPLCALAAASTRMHGEGAAVVHV